MRTLIPDEKHAFFHGSGAKCTQVWEVKFRVTGKSSREVLSVQTADVFCAKWGGRPGEGFKKKKYGFPTPSRRPDRPKTHKPQVSGEGRRTGVVDWGVATGSSQSGRTQSVLRWKKGLKIGYG